MSRYPVPSTSKLESMLTKIDGLTLDTLVRPTTSTMASPASSDMPYVLYVRSYLVTRTMIGLISVLLPTALMVGEGKYNHRGLRPQESISAYYHSTSMQDLFVGGLSVVAVLLILYLSGQPKTVDFWASSVAGVSLLGVVIFPTARDLSDPRFNPLHLKPHDPGYDALPLCGPHRHPEPASCSWTESWWGEKLIGNIHAWCATVFILSMAAICVAFAYRAYEAKKAAEAANTLKFVDKLWWGYCIAVITILGWGLWDLFGHSVWVDNREFSRLYACEVGALYTLGIAWFVKGEGLRTLWLPSKNRGRP